MDVDTKVIESIFEYQENEIKRFVNEYMSSPKASELLGCSIIGERYELLCRATREAIKSGVEEFLENEERKGKPLYPISYEDISNSMQALYNFIIDNTIRRHLTQRIGAIESTLRAKKSVRPYSEYVCEKYRMFVYEDSLNLFKKDFKVILLYKPD